MKKIHYISAFALAACTVFTSCDDFLEAENKGAGGQTADEYFSTPEGLETFRTSTFYSLRAVATPTNIYENSSDLYWPSRGRGDDEFVRFTLSSENEECEELYAACYDLINNANGLLQYGGDTYKGDALFLRAYGYYILTQQFGAVPYITTYINDANRDYPREELKTIYDGIGVDLENAYTIVADKGSTNDGTVNKRAVAALLSKIYLAAAWDLETTLGDASQGTYNVTGTSYASKAAQWAETAISGINLTQSFEQKWSPTNEDSNPETFFSVQYDRASSPTTGSGHGLQNDWGSYYGDITSTFMKSSGSTKVPSSKSLYLWQSGDERFNATFMTTMYNTDEGVWGTEGYFAYYNATDAAKETLPIAWYYAPYYVSQSDFEAQLTAMASRFQNGKANEPHAYLLSNPMVVYSFTNGQWRVDSSLGGTYDDAKLQSSLNIVPPVKKWDDPNTAQSNGSTTEDYRDIVLLHASDIYLVAAEAYMLMDQDPQCLAKINAVRTRANAGTISSLSAYDPDYSRSGSLRMIDLILDERARELYAENQRYMDLRRTRQLVKYNVAYNNYISSVSDMSSPQGEIKWYRPIPANELSSNTSEGMYQNPGY